MQINLQPIYGNWDKGYVLDRHTKRSEVVDHDWLGREIRETDRTDAGEALYQLKYCESYDKAEVIAAHLASSIIPKFESISLIIPMPPSTERERQPVTEIAEHLSKMTKIPIEFYALSKRSPSASVKNIESKSEKEAVLRNSFQVKKNKRLAEAKSVLLLDDLYDTGATMETACNALRQGGFHGAIHVAAVTCTMAGYRNGRKPMAAEA